jgi:small subunit ribosomal protein S16
MVKIRLSRHGSKKHPFYRIVVAASESPRDGRYIEQVGLYDPTKNPPFVRLDHAKIQTWRDKGAQPSATVREIIERNAPAPAPATPEAAPA